MTAIETYEFNISKHFPCLIEYGNDGAYSEEDEEQVDTFLSHLIELKVREGATHYIIDYGNIDDTDFTRCDICKLMADCCTIKVTFY